MVTIKTHLISEVHVIHITLVVLFFELLSFSRIWKDSYCQARSLQLLLRYTVVSLHGPSLLTLLASPSCHTFSTHWVSTCGSSLLSLLMARPILPIHGFSCHSQFLSNLNQ